MKVKKKETYDRRAVGLRLKDRRRQRGWSRKYVAEKIGLVEKYYADIERGTCGMSVETLMALTDLYDFTMDSLIYGEKGRMGIFAWDKTLLKNLETLSPQMQDNCRQLLALFVSGVNGEKRENKPLNSAEMAESTSA